MSDIYVLDLFSGMLGFHYAARNFDRFKTICASETDSYCHKLITQIGIDNVGDVTLININRDDHPHISLVNQGLVPVEETGFSSLCIEDFYEGAVEWPNMVIGGFPCTEISSANSKSAELGIKGKNSGLVEDQLNIIEDLEPEYAFFENSSLLINRGLDVILKRLSKLGYTVEWEIISATAFGMPHYRHRCFIFAYRNDTKLAHSGIRIFDYLRAIADTNPLWKIPLLEAAPEYIKSFAVVENTRSIKLRTKRINALGNTVIPDIPENIFATLDSFLNGSIESMPYESIKEKVTHRIKSEILIDQESNSISSELPTRGLMKDGSIYSSAPCRKLNPTKTQYQGLYSTLMKKDGNNNFGCKSRLTRPGKLGGLVCEIMSLGVDQGGLDPQFCEVFMGYPPNYTKLDIH